MEIDKEDFKKKFKNLAKEMGIKEDNTSIIPVKYEKLKKEKFRNYKPDVTDFLRRCKNKEEALEIIKYLHKKREITSKEASQLKKKFRSEGIRIFGSKKEENYYLKQ
jgi:hypothetical protein